MEILINVRVLAFNVKVWVSLKSKYFTFIMIFIKFQFVKILKMNRVIYMEQMLNVALQKGHHVELELPQNVP